MHMYNLTHLPIITVFDWYNIFGVDRVMATRRLVQTWTADRQTKKSLVAHDITNLLQKGKDLHFHKKGSLVVDH